MHSTHIIAEAGANHAGNLRLARQLIDIATAAGCDSVKFQDIAPEGLYIARYVEYPAGSTHRNEVLARRESERLSRDDILQLYAYGKERGIPVTFSVFDPDDARFHAAQRPLYLKVASTDVNYVDLLETLAETDVPIIVSTGMASAEDVDHVVALFWDAGALDRLTLLHCVSVYPCPYADAELGRITALKEKYPVPVGFSDHTQDADAAAVAVALGATVLEKHFTADKEMPGFDHKFASNPPEIQEYVRRVRETERALRFSSSARQPAEHVTRNRARRGLYAARDVAAGHVLTREDVIARRPSNTLGPEDIGRLVGMPVAEAVRQFQGISIDGGKVYPDRDNLWKAAAAHWNREMHEKGM